ncbi:hypothetical protein HO133_008206 [Letharia lupina]|uniref:Vacuolar protein sorting-associated protein TDA6 n=1 Tax=Letharia lupina TaxID=560253 RepID=A0A8H6CSE5_9LECA|nr:uncharacterized protein HO133_008206 [Letharia lupina]KAF6228476.1 hypothetical protein HO133_008206 [Letharia lupina]
MGRSPRSLDGGLGDGENVSREAVLMILEKEGDGVEKAPQNYSSPCRRSHDVAMKNRRTSVKLPILLGFILVAFIFTTPHTVPVIPTRLRGQVGAWLKMCGSHLGWQDPSVIDIRTRPEDLAKDPRVMHEIPQYVLDYAPLVHLYSEEQFWPCDIKEHLFHVTPELNYTPIQGLPQLNLSNLDQLNEFEQGRHVFLTSNDNVEDRPDWLGGQINIPDDFSDDSKTDCSDSRATSARFRKQSHGGHSDAPAVLLTINKGDGIVDAFWFFFYSYNLGNIVFNIRFGNHIGDWEHTLIRFEHGKPKVVFVSEHFFGSAYSYSAVEKIGNRPVVYSAVGTHAMYATPGTHPYILPLGILHDETDRGPLWDPALNSLTYTYNHVTDTLHPSNRTPDAPTQWFYFSGKWGDKFYPLNDNRQYGFAGEYHYVNGPLGPRFKHLGRRKVCQGRYSDPCVIKDQLDPDEVREWPGLGEGDDWPDPEMRPPGLPEGGDD